MQFFTLVLFILITNFYYAQDVIFYKNGKQELVKVHEIISLEIKYKKLDNLNGPLFVVPLINLKQIQYENGLIENFINLIERNVDSAYIINSAQSDALNYYKNYKKEMFKTFFSSILLTPIMGYINYKKVFKKIN